MLVREHLHVHLQSRELVWRKSTASNPSGNCVELAELAGGDVAVRNSRHPGGPTLVYTRAEIAAFIAESGVANSTISPDAPTRSELQRQAIPGRVNRIATPCERLRWSPSAGSKG